MPTVRKIANPDVPTTDDEGRKTNGQRVVLNKVANIQPLVVEHKDLPPGWTWTTLGEATRLNGRDTALRDLPDSLPVTFVPMAVVDAASGTIMTPEERSLAQVRKGFTSFAEGDVLFAKITPCMENGKAAIAKGLTNGRGFGSTEFHVLKPQADVLSEWIFYFVRQESFRKDAKSNFTGTAGQLRVPASFLEDYPFPLPPLAEQRRIVEAIEQQLTRLDAGVASLKRVQAGLRRYKAAVLKAACEGRLVPQDAGDDPADALLRRILDERRAKWEAEQIAKMRAQGRMVLDDGWRAKYQEPQGPDMVGLPEIPISWQWIRLGQLAWSVKDGPHYSPKYVDAGVPFISGGQVRPEGIDFTSAKYISPDLHAELSKRCKPEKGDLLYTKGGTTGIARVNTYDTDFNVWVHVAILKLIDSVDRFYLQHILNSPFCYAQAQRFTHGVGNQDLGLTRMVNIVLPLPPLAEQQRIVAEVERRLSVVAEVEAAVAANLKRAERLRQAILKRAFAGKLVPQDPSDEPASVLLERIRQEREPRTENQEPKRGGKRKTKQLRMDL